ncbi:hypothetical protein F52700_2551 [Fusarium sp. NRRL 52700]|nr:hypothetical protein F52700_2551 [Fusarium sp. NRRL 52700]
MASPSTLMTVTSPTATLDVPAQHYDSKPSHSDKIVIIGLTVGMVALFLLFIAPCCCMQYLAHRQQRKEKKANAILANHVSPLGESSPYLASQLTSQSTTTMTNTIHRRMSDTSVVIAIAISCTVIVVIFLGAVSLCNWRSRPKSPTGTRGHGHEDSDANSDVEMSAMPGGALNHPLVQGRNGAGHVYPVFEATRERPAHAQN